VGIEEERKSQASLTAALRQEVSERRLEGVGRARMDFLCECSDPGCHELVSITLDECDFVRRVPNRLVVRVGHADHETERVLMEEPGRFQVVERFGSSDDVVAHIAPWSTGASGHPGRAA
jgi:DNA-binding sugar fermentation-stimulating protein